MSDVSASRYDSSSIGEPPRRSSPSTSSVRHRGDYNNVAKKKRHSSSNSDSSSANKSKRKKREARAARRERKRLRKARKKASKLTQGPVTEKFEAKLTENDDTDELIGPDPKMMQRHSMKPMSKEEWEKQQSVLRHIYDPESGRTRLIKGDGEVMEEIVTYEQHLEINKKATEGDGAQFQAKLGLQKKTLFDRSKVKFSKTKK